MKPVSVIFDTAQGSTDYGKMVISVVNDNSNTPIGPTLQVYIGITGPAGVIKAVPGSPDVTVTSYGVTATYKHVIPVDAAGDFLKGNYTIQVNLTAIDGGSSDDGSETQTYNFCPPSVAHPELNIGFSLNCVAKTLTITDDTVYGSWEGTKTLSVQPPTIPPSVTPPTPISSLTGEVVINLAYTNVVYVATLTADISTETEIGSFTFQTAYYGSVQESYTVNCDVYGCAWLNCYNQFLRKVNSMAVKAGDITRIGPIYNDYLQLIGQVQLYIMAKGCGNNTLAGEASNVISNLLSCNCGCSQEVSDEPLPILPL